MKSLLLVCLIVAISSQSIASLLKGKNPNPPTTGGTFNSTAPVFNSTNNVYMLNQSTSNQRYANATAPQPQYTNSTQNQSQAKNNATIKPHVVTPTQVNQTNATYYNSTQPMPQNYANVTNQASNSSSYKNSTQASNATYYNSTTNNQNSTYQNNATVIKPQKANSTQYNQTSNATYQNSSVQQNYANVSTSSSNSTKAKNSTKRANYRVNTTNSVNPINQANMTNNQTLEYNTAPNNTFEYLYYDPTTNRNFTVVNGVVYYYNQTIEPVSNQTYTDDNSTQYDPTTNSNYTVVNGEIYYYNQTTEPVSNQTYNNGSIYQTTTYNQSYTNQSYAVNNSTRSDNSTYKRKLRKIATGQWNVLEQNEFLFRNTNIVGEALVAIKQIHETREEGFEFLEIVSVSEQIVAGINYDIKMRFANQEGQTRLFNVLIYTAPWTRQSDQIVSCEEIIDSE